MSLLNRVRVRLAEVLLGLAAHLFWPDTRYRIDYENDPPSAIVLRREL